MRAEAGIEGEIRELEERLLDPWVRADPLRVGELLADDFLELGASGRTWSKRSITEALRRERAARHTVSRFRARLIAPGAVLATYHLTTEPESPEPPRASLRSSIWVRRGERWQILFHQGTPSARRKKT